jgi:(p)ppGpp synthase/HD superfamily hydrolase
MNLIKVSKLIAKQFHKGQKDKSGKDYFLHVERVAKKGKNKKEIIVGYLHDVLEDTNIDKELLKEIFGSRILHVLNILNKNNYNSAKEYLNAIKRNKIALAVKINDIKDNSNKKRLDLLKDKEKQRLIKKYNEYKKILNIK